MWCLPLAARSCRQRSKDSVLGPRGGIAASHQPPARICVGWTVAAEDPEADRLARELAARIGETLPVIDNRSAEEILGYDHRGLPS